MFRKQGAITTVLIMVMFGILLMSSGTAFAEEPQINIKLCAALGVEESNAWLCDGNGMALYFFINDSPGVSNCTGDCVTNWPLFFLEKPVMGPRLKKANYKASDFTAVTREDGKPQTAFKGWPLYYFAKDQKSGDTLGKGVKDVWVLAVPNKLPSK